MQSSSRIVSEFFERDDVIEEMLRRTDEEDSEYSESDSEWEEDDESDTEVLESETDSEDDDQDPLVDISPIAPRRIVEFRLPPPALPASTFVARSLFSPPVLRRETPSDYIHVPPPLVLRRETPSDYSPLRIIRITPRRRLVFN